MPRPPDPLRALRWHAAVAWAAWMLTMLLLWWQDRAGVLHPYGALFVLLVLVTFAAALGGLVRGLWRVRRGPRRARALAWAAAAVLPWVIWASMAAHVLHDLGRGEAPRNLAFRLVAMGAASVMEFQAQHLYPHRLETPRLVMFYDDRVAEAERDAEAMERHVARLEKLTGRPLREKIYWVRGRLLGRGRSALYGLALGSEEGPAEWQGDDRPSLDRHELAHAVLHQRYTPDTDPPFLLVEGWAESQSGPGPAALARRALQSRAYKRRSLRELVGPDWYHHIGAAVYDVGGGFADFLLRRHGAGKFLELYFGCGEATFPEDVRRVYGTDLDALETQFWADAEAQARGLIRPGP